MPDRRIKVAHIAIATPRRCGLYETARELVAAERQLGADARIVDPKPVPQFYPKTPEDRGAPLADMAWAVQADVILSHSGHDGTPVAETQQPIIHVAHGRPLSTWLGERSGGAPGYTYALQRRGQDRYKACLTFWEEYEPYFRELWDPKPVVVAPAPVDLEYWCPGTSDYDFHGMAGKFNVVMTDPWSRVDTPALHCIHAFALFHEKVPGAKLHIFAHDGKKQGMDAIGALLKGGLGLVQTWAGDLRTVYRAADMLITPHRIDTRAVREATACGVPSVTGRDVHPEDIEAFADAMVAQSVLTDGFTRKRAEAMWNPVNTAKVVLGLAGTIVLEDRRSSGPGRGPCPCGRGRKRLRRAAPGTIYRSGEWCQDCAPASAIVELAKGPKATRKPVAKKPAAKKKAAKKPAAKKKAAARKR